MKRFSPFVFVCFSFFSTFGEEIIFINSNKTRYTKDQICCDGNVIIIYCNRVISADSISYNKRSEIITAAGNIIVEDEKQNTYFMDSLTVTKNFKSGKAKNIKVIMQDNKSRLAATECVIRDEKFELKNAIYTPCYLCTDEGDLTWQIKSADIVFDPEDCVEYEDVQFEFLGTKIFYIPYLASVSPKIKRKSGFLASKFSNSSKSGFNIRPQYLWVISQSQELIVKPIITTKIGYVGWIYYGIRFPNGEFNIDTSITGVKSVDSKIEDDKTLEKIHRSGYRGHIFSKGRYEINDTWRLGTDINLVSDMYYIKRFPFFKEVDRAFESNAKLEEFDGGNYILVKGAMFQGERTKAVPRIFPIIERNYSNDLLYGTFSFDSSFTNLDFNHRRSAQKIVSNISWYKKILLHFGGIFDIKGTVSLRGLKVSEKQKSEYDSFFNAIPQLCSFLQLPLVLSSKMMDTIFTPIVGTIISNNKKYKDVFEDPLSEINAINLFDGNRSVSQYGIDSGKRICYGLKLSSYKSGENLYRFIVGRSVELTTQSEKLEATGLKHKHSNIVTAADIFLTNELTLTTNGSYCAPKKRWSKIETGLCFADGYLNFDLMIFKGRQCRYDPFAMYLYTLTEEQKTQKYRGFMFDAGYNINNNWKLKGGIVIGNEFKDQVNLNEKQSNVYKLVRCCIELGYKNECTEVDFAVERRNYDYGDLKPETVFKFTVQLKNLGD
jgi:LPS-assembly protein